MCCLMNRIHSYLQKTNTHQLFTTSTKHIVSIQNSNRLNLISCEIDLSFTPFVDAKLIVYKNEISTTGNKMCFN